MGMLQAVPGLNVQITILRQALTEYAELQLAHNKLETNIVPVDNKPFSIDFTFTKEFLNVIKDRIGKPNEAVKIQIFVDGMKKPIATSSIRLKCIAGQIGKGSLYIKLMPTIRRRVHDRFVHYPYKFLPLQPANIPLVQPGTYENWGVITAKVLIGRFEARTRTSTGSGGVIPKACNSYDIKDIPKVQSRVPPAIIARGTSSRVGFGKGRDTHCQAPCKSDTPQDYIQREFKAASEALGIYIFRFTSKEILESQGVQLAEPQTMPPSHRSARDMSHDDLSSYVAQLEGYLATLPQDSMIKFPGYLQDSEQQVPADRTLAADLQDATMELGTNDLPSVEQFEQWMESIGS